MLPRGVWSDRGRQLAGTDGRSVSGWDGDADRTWTTPLPQAASQIALAADGHRIALGLADGRVLVGPRGGAPAEIGSSSAPVTALALAGDRVVAASNDGTVRAWRLDSRERDREWSPPWSVASLRASADGATVLTVSRDAVRALRFDDGRIRAWTLLRGRGGTATALGWD
jgi:WD40 repeat protein